MVPEDEKLDHVIRKLTRERRSTVSFNTSTPQRTKFQSGGTVMMTFNGICHSKISSERGKDPRGLDSMTFIGFNNNRTTYYLVKSSKVGGAYMQQVAYIQEFLEVDQEIEHSIP